MYKKRAHLTIFFFFIISTITGISNETVNPTTPASPNGSSRSFGQILKDAPDISLDNPTGDTTLPLNEPNSTDQGKPNAITMMAVIVLFALVPFAIILLTSFLKTVIVLSLLRNALGVQQAPPNQALTGIALLMSIYVMFPTCVAMYNSGKDYITNHAPTELFSPRGAAYIYNVVGQTKEPLKEFLSKNTTPLHQKKFYQLASRSLPENVQSTLKPNDLIVLAPAYITSQLKGAFEIGVLIYLPFFVIDLVTSNILLAMGMMMLSPLTIALPLKLLLIVMTDGWTLIIQGLVQTYRH